MFTDTFTAPQKTLPFKTNWLAALRRLVSDRFRKGKALSVNDLSASHYRDLGLPMYRHGATDTRPHIILGPM